jgi:hypothetical protein
MGEPAPEMEAKSTYIEEYMGKLLEASSLPDSGYLGAYNMGVWGVSVSGRPPLEDGLSTSGKVLTEKPKFTPETRDNPCARNFVKFHDTPNIWGYGDETSDETMGMRPSWSEIAMTARVQKAVDGESAWVGLVDRWAAVISESQYLVDITSLSPPGPETYAAQQICEGISQCIQKWTQNTSRRLMIRILFGMTSVVPGMKTCWQEFGDLLRATLQKHAATIQGAPNAPVVLYGSDLGSMQKIKTFNHSKIVAGDGLHAIVGGHNMCEEVSSNRSPVIHDITSEVKGPGARSANAFAGSLWAKAAESGRLDILRFNWATSTFADVTAKAAGSTPVLPIASGAQWVNHVAKPPLKYQCDVVKPAACTGQSFYHPLGSWSEQDTVWCKRCGHFYCPYHGPFSEVYLPAGGFHTCNSCIGPLGSQEGVPHILDAQYWYYPMDTLPRTGGPESCPPGFVPATAIMGVGRWGDTKVFSADGSSGLKFGAVKFTDIPISHACQYASDAVKRLMVHDENFKVIRMSQQDLVNAGVFGGQQPSEHVICQMLGERLKEVPKGLAIQVVVSSRFTQNSEGLAYSYGDGPREAIERIYDTITGVDQPPAQGIGVAHVQETGPCPGTALDLTAEVGSAAVHLVGSQSDPSFCTVAPLAFCEARGATRDRGSYVWSDAKSDNSLMGKVYTSSRYWNRADAEELRFGPGNHAKVLYVSEESIIGDKMARKASGLVMVGSDNMYPSPLAEFNFVFEGPEVIEAFRRQYWDLLWKYSGRLGFTVDSDGKLS